MSDITPTDDPQGRVTRPDAWPPFATTINFSRGRDVGDAIHVAEALARHHRAWVSQKWTTAEAGSGLDAVRAAATRVLFDTRHPSPGVAEVVLEFGDCVAQCQVNRKVSAATVYLTVSGPDIVTISAVCDRVRQLLPAIDDSTTPSTVPVHFWSTCGIDADSVERRLDAPTWDEVAPNYSARTRAGLEPLMGDLDAVAAGGAAAAVARPAGHGQDIRAARTGTHPRGAALGGLHPGA